VSARDVRLAHSCVLRRGRAAVGRHGHYIREGDSRRLGQQGEQNQSGEYGNLYKHGKQQGAATRAASAMELVGVAIDEACAQGC
jgi:hypothetical protein